jgi:hypothetical protein
MKTSIGMDLAHGSYSCLQLVKEKEILTLRKTVRKTLFRTIV